MNELSKREDFQHVADIEKNLMPPQAVARLGKLSLPAQTEEQAALLGPDHFESRLPLTVSEENRFVELFGYYPNGLGL